MEHIIPMPAYFYVRVDKEKQKNRKEKEGNIYVVTYDESRNLQEGEIVAIGEDAAQMIPQAKIGDTLIYHWMVETKEKNQLVGFDEKYNYYVVTAMEWNGQANQSYGIWDGENIIPNMEYIFLEIKKDERTVSQTKGGLFLFDNWTDTRKDSEEKMEKLNAEIQSLTKTKMNEDLKNGIAAKEKELEKLSNKINSKRIEFYEVAAINPIFNEEIEKSFGHIVSNGDKIGMLNIACVTTVFFGGKEYIVALSKHFHLTYQWAKKSVAKL